MTIISQLYEAQHLSKQLPSTREALHTGCISLAHVREITRETIADRMRRNRSERRVHGEADHDGVAWLHLYLPVEQDAAIEADIAADLLEHGQIGAKDTSRSATCTDGAAPVRPVLNVTVPALT